MLAKVGSGQSARDDDKFMGASGVFDEIVPTRELPSWKL